MVSNYHTMYRKFDTMKILLSLITIRVICVCVRTVMSWQVTEAAQVTEQSLVLFKLLVPKIDLLVSILPYVCLHTAA